MEFLPETYLSQQFPGLYKVYKEALLLLRGDLPVKNTALLVTTIGNDMVFSWNAMSETPIEVPSTGLWIRVTPMIADDLTVTNFTLTIVNGKVSFDILGYGKKSNPSKQELTLKDKVCIQHIVNWVNQI